MLVNRRLRLFQRLVAPMGFLGIAMIIGTTGYMLIEKYSFLDAFYMTVITVASVGFQEVHPLSYPGKIFTIGLIFVNLGLFTYFIALLTRYFLDGEWLNEYKSVKMLDKIAALDQHVIVCGFGRNGREASQTLFNNHIGFVVIEEKNDPGDDLDFEVKHFIRGNATRDEVLLDAGIRKAKAIITTLPVDADNLFVVLTARQLRPDILIISRASQDSSVSKLRIAGATNVIMPDKIGGAHMASLVMIPDVVEFLSLMSITSKRDFKVEELRVEREQALGELDLWRSTGCTVLGVKNSSDYHFNPAPNYRLRVNERIILMGSEEQIVHAAALLNGH